MNIVDHEGRDEGSGVKPESKRKNENSTIPDGDSPPPQIVEGTEPRSFPLRKVIRIGLIVAAVLLLLRMFAVAPYAIPTGSMYPAIIEGDVLLINKLPYYIRTPDRLPFTNISIPYLELPGLGTLERGDVVVFIAPVLRRNFEESNRLVKRCVALPGDTLMLTDGLIEVNGVEPPLPQVGESSDSTTAPLLRTVIDPHRAFEPLRRNRQVIVPFSGYDLPLDSLTAASWQSVIENEGVSVEYRNNIVFLNGRPATYYRFQQDYFFALGDNSEDSYDSRFFGFIPKENLIGQAMFVYWSRDPDDGLRWNRLGTWIK